MTTSPAATDTGTRVDASCSFAARDSGANIGTQSITPSSAVGPGAFRSIAARRVQVATARTGRSRPTATRAAFAPRRATTAGAEVHPRATPPHPPPPVGAGPPPPQAAGNNPLRDGDP